MAKLAGHAQQLLGYALVFLGLGLATAVFIAAGSYPTVSTWVFVTGAIVVGSPLMVAGGRINSRGRGQVLGQSPEHAAREYREQNVLMAVYFGFVGLQTCVIVAPMFACIPGWLHATDLFVRIWVIGWLLFLCAGRDWISRPLWRAIERRVRARWNTQ